MLAATMDGTTPAQIYALTIGFLLVALGVAGFFYEASFEVGSDVPRDAVIGIFDVNGWHNVVHLLSGAFGLLVATSYAGARVYALVFGGVGLLPVSTEENVLHLLIGIAGVIAGLSTPDVPAPSVERAAA
jgi:Domain of unknown function (DUF4383)